MCSLQSRCEQRKCSIYILTLRYIKYLGLNMYYVLYIEYILKGKNWMEGYDQWLHRNYKPCWKLQNRTENTYPHASSFRTKTTAAIWNWKAPPAFFKWDILSQKHKNCKAKLRVRLLLQCMPGNVCREMMIWKTATQYLLHSFQVLWPRSSNTFWETMKSFEHTQPITNNKLLPDHSSWQV